MRTTPEEKDAGLRLPERERLLGSDQCSWVYLWSKRRTWHPVGGQ